MRARVTFVLWALISAPAAAQPMSIELFRQHLAAVEARLDVVWREVVRPIANNTPGYDGQTGSLRLAEPVNCSIMPEYDLSEQVIRFERLIFPASASFLEQVVLMHILGLEEVSAPEQVDAYVTGRLMPYSRQQLEKCIVTGEMHADLLDVATLNYFGSSDYRGRPYMDVMADAQARPQAPELADVIAAYPVFFAILHEAGHHVLHRSTVTPLEQREAEADQFAMDVFDHGGAPVTLGLPFLQLVAAPNNRRQMECRLAIAAGQDTDADIDRTMAGFPAAYRQRIKALRDFYMHQYGASCR